MQANDLGFLIRALDQSNDGILITDADMTAPGPRIVYVNAAYQRMSGYSAAELVGQSPRIVQGPSTDRALLDALKAAMARGESFHGETFNYRKDGAAYRVEWDIAPVRDDGGRAEWLISIQRDVTIRFEADEALKRASVALRHSNDRLRELGGVLSHDLQEPLTAVRGYLELLKMRHADTLGADVRYIDTAIAGTDAMVDRIRGLLTEAVRRDALPQAVPLDPVARAALADLRDAVETVGGEVVIDTLPVAAALPQEMREIFHNLLSNAIKYRAPDRPLRIGISGYRIQETLVQVAVSDNGRGIPPEDHAAIFETGHRSAAHDDVAGTGFGLSFVRGALERCGGKIAVHSRPGEGATFIMTLPAA
jgi:PAS domain S-box-containing protein